jgi:hypothetical protein
MPVTVMKDILPKWSAGVPPATHEAGGTPALPCSFTLTTETQRKP